MTQSSHLAIRPPAVAGSFYPAHSPELRALVDRLLANSVGRSTADATQSAPLRGVLVPHAGLEWSGVVAAAGWRVIADAIAGVAQDDAVAGVAQDDAVATTSGAAGRDTGTVVVLGTNHSAWLRGAGVWPDGAWRTPLGDVAVDPDVAVAIAELGPPFEVNRGVHAREHSIEVQLPLLQTVAPGVRIVPVAVAAGRGPEPVAAGTRLGRLIARLDRPASRVLLAISSDLAHYPAHADCARVTDALLPPIAALDAEAVDRRELALLQAGIPDLACGMCGIEPTVLGLAALREAGARQGSALAAATSADAGGPVDRTVGYLAVAFA